jgi:hypothetical protein
MGVPRMAYGVIPTKHAPRPARGVPRIEREGRAGVRRRKKSMQAPQVGGGRRRKESCTAGAPRVGERAAGR